MTADERTRAESFDAAAAAYEKIRPGYPDELYRAIFAYLPLDASRRAAEIGIGSGQASLPILRTGCALTAVEPGARFSALCRQKFGAFRGFRVLTAPFEDADLAPDSFDLVYSATAFHWISEQIGYPKAFSILKEGGAFARFANHAAPARDDPALLEEIERAYADYYYKFYRRAPERPAEYGEEQARLLAERAGRYGFTELRWAVFRRTRTLSAAEYRMLLGTYSDHLALEPELRAEFFSKIEEAILRHGGFLAISDIVDLQLARKPRHSNAR